MAWQSTLEEERRKLEELAEESIGWWRERLETSFLRLERLNDEPPGAFRGGVECRGPLRAITFSSSGARRPLRS